MLLEKHNLLIKLTVLFLRLGNFYRAELGDMIIDSAVINCAKRNLTLIDSVPLSIPQRGWPMM